MKQIVPLVVVVHLFMRELLIDKKLLSQRG
jgi:hypothetical protein